MSFDLTFAKPKRRIPKKQVAYAYPALARGEPVDVFEPLPVDDILSALSAAYEDFEPAAAVFPTSASMDLQVQLLAAGNQLFRSGVPVAKRGFPGILIGMA